MRGKYWWACLCVCACGALNASEMSGRLQSGRPIIWSGVAHNADEWSPAYWDVAMRLPPAQKLVPGGPDSVAPRLITLTSESGDSVVLPVSVVGVEYRLPQAGEVSPLSTGSQTKVQGVSVTVRGAGVGDKLINYGASVTTPFTHYRPILDFSGVNWTALFKDKNSGVFEGRVPVSVGYDYYRESVRIHHTIVLPLTIKVDYIANTVTDVHVTGDGVMQARYYGYPERLVSGETMYQVRVEGTVPNGVWVGLRNSLSSDGRFYLTRTDSAEDTTAIPFGVQCEGCTENSEFINIQGEAQITMVTRAKAPEAFNLRVSFADATMDNLTNATYSGAFTLVFEAAL